MVAPSSKSNAGTGAAAANLERPNNPDAASFALGHPPHAQAQAGMPWLPTEHPLEQQRPARFHDFVYKLIKKIFTKSAALGGAEFRAAM